MNDLISKDLEIFKKFLGIELNYINNLYDIEIPQNSYRTLIYPTNDFFLYEHQFDAVKSLVKQDEKIYVFQLDDLSFVHEFSYPFDYKAYCCLNLYSVSIMFSNSLEWIIIIDEAVEYGKGVFISNFSLKEKFENIYNSKNDLSEIIKFTNEDTEKRKYDISCLNKFISMIEAKQ